MPGSGRFTDLQTPALELQAHVAMFSLLYGFWDLNSGPYG